MTYPTMPAGEGPDVSAGATDNDGKMWVPGAHANHPSDGPGVNYSTPDQYYGPTVSLQPALVNPSAGTQGETEQGMDDVNPRGPAPVVGQSVTAPGQGQVYPDTTVEGPPSRGASTGPRG